MKFKLPKLKLNLFTGIAAVAGVAAIAFILKNNNKNAMVARSYYSEPLSQALSQGTYASRIKQVYNLDGHPELFVVGTDLALYHTWEWPPNSGRWSNWQSLGGKIGGDFYVRHNQQGGLSVIAVGTDGAYYLNDQIWSPRGLNQWTGWRRYSSY